MKLNGLLASPSFAAWAEGVPMDMASMLSTDAGPSCSVVYLAHLSEEERQFVVTLLLSKLVTWMRAQSGTPDLRALVYMDEVFGYVPPTAAPPAKKPILTILKQARAFGVGMVLSTQNPVDLDYKAISNAGTWMIGRLQTERDVGRLSDGLKSSAGDVDIDALTGTISGLGKREFVLHTTKGKAPKVFTTRWALDYLAGPLTKDQVGALPGQPRRRHRRGRIGVGAPRPPSRRPIARSRWATTRSTAPPKVADGTPVRWIDPAAPWLGRGRRRPRVDSYRAGIAARVELLFDETKADLRHTEEFECVVVGLGETFDADEIVAVDFDDRDLREAAPERAAYQLTDAPIGNKTFFSGAEKAIKDKLYRDQTLTVRTNTTLKLYSRPGESEEDFAARCEAAADAKADEDAAKIRKRLESKMSTVQQGHRARADPHQRARGEEVGHQAARGHLGRRRPARLAPRRQEVGQVDPRQGQGRVVPPQGSRRPPASGSKPALAKVEQKEMELGDLEAELADAIADIAAEWDDVAAEVEEVEVGLEKTDISVTQLALVWIPV